MTDIAENCIHGVDLEKVCPMCIPESYPLEIDPGHDAGHYQQLCQEIRELGLEIGPGGIAYTLQEAVRKQEELKKSLQTALSEWELAAKNPWKGEPNEDVKAQIASLRLVLTST